MYSPLLYFWVFFEKSYLYWVSYRVVKDENNNCAGLANIHVVSRYDVVEKKKCRYHQKKKLKWNEHAKTNPLESIQNMAKNQLSSRMKSWHNSFSKRNKLIVSSIPYNNGCNSLTSRNYHICRNCGHLKISNKHLSNQNHDHPCYLCQCSKFLDYTNV